MEAAGMTADTIVTVQDTAVMYVAGDTGTPIAEQAPKAFKELEAKLSSLKGRKFYGVILGDEYRACVAMNLEDDPLSLPLIRRGRYQAANTFAEGSRSGKKISIRLARLAKCSAAAPISIHPDPSLSITEANGNSCLWSRCGRDERIHRGEIHCRTPPAVLS
jgi:hypothetical protein